MCIWYVVRGKQLQIFGVQTAFTLRNYFLEGFPFAAIQASVPISELVGSQAGH